MSYIQTDSNKNCDLNYLRYAGWTESTTGIKEFYSRETVNLISKKVSELTRGIDKLNRIIKISDPVICNVMDTVYTNYRPATGDIFSRYVVPTQEPEDQVQEMIDQTIEMIVSSIRNNVEMFENNSKLSAWVQVYGDFNTHNLTQTPPIKVREKKPSTMQFNMNY